MYVAFTKVFASQPFIRVSKCFRYLAFTDLMMIPNNKTLFYQETSRDISIAGLYFGIQTGDCCIISQTKARYFATDTNFKISPLSFLFNSMNFLIQQ